MVNSVAGNSGLGALPKASINNMLEINKDFTKTASPQPMGSPELPQVVKFSREQLQQAQNDVKSGNYYPGKYVNILA